MSRLDEECIMYIGRNRSGIDSGEIDYGIVTEKFENLNLRDLKEAVRCLEVLQDRLYRRIYELGQKREGSGE